MKKSMVTILTIFITWYGFGQEFKQPSEGKSLVYFIRSSGTGALINFKYFDGDRYLGKASGVNYFIYECDPGAHIFWAAAENRDFIKGELQPDATYVIEVRPTMGAFKAAVRLHQVSPENEKMLRKINKIRAKREPSELKGHDEDLAFFIENGLKRYDKIENEVKVINPNWTFK
ncbi:MAG: hypothetical protein AAGA66_12810 [Bacteroidota bacterium]